MKTCIAILALLFAASVSAETTVEIGPGWQLFAGPDDETAETKTGVIVSTGATVTNRLGVEGMAGVTFRGEQSFSFGAGNIVFRGHPVSLYTGVAIINQSTAHLTGERQFTAGFIYRFDHYSIRYLHISNGERFGLGDRPNLGEDMLLFGIQF